MTKSSTEVFRNQYRSSEISQGYNGKLHFWLMTIACLLIIFFSVAQLKAITLAEALVVPIAFLLVNAAEYFGHRGPMHHYSQRLASVFKRHTLQHHDFFTYDKMYFDTLKDAKAVLFPPVLLLFFFLIFALPSWFIFYLLWSKNAGFIFLATLFSYYLNYEWLHFAYHLPPEHGVSKIPLIKTLRKLHHLHHEKSLMTKYNFNISYPIFDVLFGTYKKVM